MGAELAVHNKQPALVGLSGFADVVVAKLELEAGAWVIIGRAVLHNHDSDYQGVSAKIVHDANVVIDKVDIYANGRTRHCLAVQAR